MKGLDTGDTAWMLASTALVLFMTPGLAAFYGGMVRKKNVLSTTMHSFFAMGTASVIWALVGYTLAFSDGSGPLAPFIGGLDFLGLNGIVSQSLRSMAHHPRHRSSRCSRACSRSSPSPSSPAQSPSG